MLYINFAFLRKVNIKEYLLYYFEFFLKLFFFKNITNKNINKYA